MTTAWSKARLLLGMLAANPSEFSDRVRAILEVRLDALFRKPPPYPPMPWEQVMDGVTRTLGFDAAAFNREIDDHRLETMIAAGVARLGANPVFALRHNADFRFARLCYIACRAARPEIVVETGVAHGVTTTFVLTALAANDRGRLYSIDLPPLGGADIDSVGRLVPDHLRTRWTLLRGTSRRTLPPLLERVGKVDLFIHDSLHTWQNMSREFAAAQRHRADPLVLLADDLESNRAFQDYLDRLGPAVVFHAFGSATAKDSRYGIAIVRSVASGQ